MGPGHNRVHVNAVNHGPNHDSIVISSRHQSSVVKIGRDKQVKWILTTPTDRSDKYKGKILTSVGKDGKPPLKCENNACESGFDWTRTQHTARTVDSKTIKDVLFLTLLPDMTYSRAAIRSTGRR